MSRGVHGWRRALVAVAMITSTALSSTQAAAGPPRSAMPPPACADTSPAPPGGKLPAPALEMVLDDRGWLVGHRLALSEASTVSLGRVAFMEGPFGSRLVYGDLSGGHSMVTVLDAVRGCVEAGFSVPGIVFTATIDPSGTFLYHDLVDQVDRAEMGIWRHSLDGSIPATRAMPGVSANDPIAPVWANSFAWGPKGDLAVQSCGVLECMTRSLGSVPGRLHFDRSPGQGALVGLATDGPVFLDGECAIEPCPVRGSGDGRLAVEPGPSLQALAPVPESQPQTWAPNKVLRYRWSGGDQTPPSWMRPAIHDAASAVADSRRSRAATFAFSSDADDTIGVVEKMSGNCIRAIACASRDIPHWWRIWLRPHQTEMHWGTLKWCQAYSKPEGNCFDIERTVLHEMGHVEGLAHPDASQGLSATDTVMHGLIPRRGQPGWQMHRFGPCDVARLQRRYDVLGSGTSYALCDRVDTRITVGASASSVPFRGSVTITATLRVRDRDGYGELGGNLVSGRDVLIQRRPPGGSWTSFDASRGASPGTYQFTFHPWMTYEYRAAFDQPSGDGLSGDISGVVTVNIAKCTSLCPEAATARYTSRSH